MPILAFKGPYRFLSNFFPCQIEYEGIVYPTSEHAFQAAKFTDERIKKVIASSETPAKAKQFGRLSGPSDRENWGTLRIDVMKTILRIKFSKPAFRDSLLRTGNEELIEGNDWGDKFWGVCDGVGSNHLGKLLMEVRRELKDASLYRTK